MKSYLVELGQRVKICRKSMRLTQAQLAEIAGLSPNFISTLELGKCSISAENIVQLCRALEISADYLLFGKEDEELDIELKQDFMRMNKMDDDKRTHLKEVLAPLIRAIEEPDGDGR